MHVVLIHGMGRTPAAMWLLGRRLRGLGYTTSSFGYVVTLENLEQIAGRFREHVARVVDGAQSYAIIGHSLGGLLTRLVSAELPPGWRGFVMLAPPNRQPALVRLLSRNPLYKLVFGDTGKHLDDPDLYARLPVPEVPTLVIAGVRGPRAAWLPFDGAPNDGILRVDETELPGAERLEVDGVHTFLMNRGDVFQAIRDFLAQRDFLPAKSAGHLQAEVSGLVE